MPAPRDRERPAAAEVREVRGAVSVGATSTELKSSLPFGRAFVCSDMPRRNFKTFAQSIKLACIVTVGLGRVACQRRDFAHKSRLGQ